jgi:hypothetical protein
MPELKCTSLKGYYAAAVRGIEYVVLLPVSAKKLYK